MPSFAAVAPSGAPPSSGGPAPTSPGVGSVVLVVALVVGFLGMIAIVAIIALIFLGGQVSTILSTTGAALETPAAVVASASPRPAATAAATAMPIAVPAASGTADNAEIARLLADAQANPGDATRIRALADAY